MKWVLLALLSLTLFACKSSDGPVPDDGQVKAADAGSDGSGSGEAAVAPAGRASACAKSPELGVCCEAMTPKCNDCREKNAATMDGWRTRCLKPEAVAPDCAMAPVLSCPGDGSDAARDCRQEALNTMMAWKEKCGAEETPAACDKKPATTVCCTAMIPSCDACRARGDRAVAEWQRRCAK